MYLHLIQLREYEAHLQWVRRRRIGRKLGAGKREWTEAAEELSAKPHEQYKKKKIVNEICVV
jgi:hypothetical protein